MLQVTDRVEWTALQLCGECDSDDGFVPDEWRGVVEAYCRNCGHVNPMDASQLGEAERFEWGPGDRLYVSAYATEWVEA